MFVLSSLRIVHKNIRRKVIFINLIRFDFNLCRSETICCCRFDKVRAQITFFNIISSVRNRFIKEIFWALIWIWAIVSSFYNIIARWIYKCTVFWFRWPRKTHSILLVIGIKLITWITRKPLLTCSVCYSTTWIHPRNRSINHIWTG